MSQLEGAGKPENLALPLKVYWQPGCSSCLKTKEFLLDNGIPCLLYTSPSPRDRG